MDKIGLVGYYGWGNTGDEATYVTLRQIFQQSNYDLETVLFTKFHSVFEEMHLLQNLSDSDISEINKNYKGLIFIGGGIIGGDWTLIHYAKKLIEMAEIPIVFLSVSVEIVEDYTPSDLELIKRALNKSKCISVRDEMCLKFLNALGINSEIKVIPDLVFAMQPEEVSLPNLGEFNVGLCVHPAWEKEEDFKKNLALVLDKIADKHNARIFLIPLHVNYLDDRPMLKDIFDQTENKEAVVFLLNYFSPQEIMGIIGKMNFLLSMRLHGVVMAYAKQVPFLTIEYHPKLRGFANMIGKQNWIYPKVVEEIGLTSDHYGHKYNPNIFKADEMGKVIDQILQESKHWELDKYVKVIENEVKYIIEDIFGIKKKSAKIETAKLPIFTEYAKIHAEAKNHFNLGEYHEAIEDFKKVLAALPGHVDIMLDLMKCYISLQNYGGAREILQKVLELDSSIRERMSATIKILGL